MDLLRELPVGWKDSPLNYKLGDFIVMFGGWFITALSALFGAAFWFDLLQKAANLRGTGPKADEKKKED